MPASNHKVGSPINVWQSLANKFINQSANLKVYWDRVGEIVRAKHDDLCDFIDSYIATKQELQDVTVGLIPDGTITQSKLADSLKETLPAQYVRNRTPGASDNFASGHKIGDAWYIPAITLNNLIPTPTAINPADFTIQNATSSASGSAITLTCQNGYAESALIEGITPIAGHSYVLFADVTLTSTHVLDEISLNDSGISNPVKDTKYHLAVVAEAPTAMEIKVQASSPTAINGATIKIEKLTIVDMTADMEDVPFTQARAIEYFQANSAFSAEILDYAKTRWYCTGDGKWQSERIELGKQIETNTIDLLLMSLQLANNSANIDAWCDLFGDTSMIDTANSSSYAVSGGKLTADRETIISTSATNNQAIGTGTGSVKIAQTFKAKYTGAVRSVVANMSTYSTPSDKVVCKVYSTSGGVPNALLGTSDELSPGAISTATTFTFATPVPVVAGTTYAIVFERTGTLSATAYYQMYRSNASTYADGSMYEYASGAWSAWATCDLNIKINLDMFATVRWLPVTASEALTKIAIVANLVLGSAGSVIFQVSDDGVNWINITSLRQMQEVYFDATSVYLKLIINNEASIDSLAWGGQ